MTEEDYIYTMAKYKEISDLLSHYGVNILYGCPGAKGTVVVEFGQCKHDIAIELGINELTWLKPILSKLYEYDTSDLSKELRTLETENTYLRNRISELEKGL